MRILRISIKAEILLITCLMGMIGGCASVPMDTSAADADAKRFQPEDGKGSIYICRGGGIGTAVIAQGQLDGRMIGALAPYTFIMVSAVPGHHEVSVVGQENVEVAPVDVIAGKMYFFGVSIRMGWNIGRPHIESISEKDGRDDVNDEHRAHATIYP
jgi:hypothetical protein